MTLAGSKMKIFRTQDGEGADMIDVMGSRPMNNRQSTQADRLRLLFEQINAALTPPNDDIAVTPEAARLFSMARSELEKSCLLAVKAVSRMSA